MFGLTKNDKHEVSEVQRFHLHVNVVCVAISDMSNLSTCSERLTTNLQPEIKYKYTADGVVKCVWSHHV